MSTYIHIYTHTLGLDNCASGVAVVHSQVFVPAGWWHATLNLPDDKEDRA